MHLLNIFGHGSLLSAFGHFHERKAERTGGKNKNEGKENKNLRRRKIERRQRKDGRIKKK
jgi:hypothetical protein